MADSPNPARFTGDTSLSRGASLIEATRLADRWKDAAARLEEREQLGDHWVSILETLGPNEDAVGMGVEFVNIDNPEDTRWVRLDGPEFEDFTKDLDGRLDTLKKAYVYEAGVFFPQDEVLEGDAIDGLNAMFVVQQLIQHFSSPGTDPGKGASNSRLATALRVQSCLSLSQIAKQSLGDVVKVTELVRTIIRSETAAESSLTKVFGAFGKSLEVLGIGLSGVNVGFDIYGLANAETSTEKAVYGTQLAFDSASLVASAGAAYAGLIEASSLAAALGGAGVLLGGLGIGFGALAQAFGHIAEDAAAVGKYFGDTEHAYKTGGYEYVAAEKTLKPLFGAVVQELDSNGSVQFDSQYIYRTHHGPTGSGRLNYFFWAGDFPKMVFDKSQAIDVRAGIGCPATGMLPNTADFTTLILPSTPKSYIRYDWMPLPGATTRGDYGFDVIRRLEEDYRFDYDFYIFPSEYIVNRISHEYVATTVIVKLAGRPICVHAPKFPESLQNFMHYDLQGVDAEYVVGLETGVGFSLSGSSGTRWILDARALSDATLTVKETSVLIGGVEVTVADPDSIALVVTKDSEVMRVHFSQCSAEPIAEDAAKYPDGGKNLVAHLDDLNAKRELHGSSVVVNNYTTPSGEIAGRAFYEVSMKRLVYTSGAPADLTKDVELAGDTGKDDVYFFNLTASAIWRVDPTSGVCLAKYDGLYPSKDRELVRVWQENDHIHAAFSHKLGDGNTGELAYILQPDSMRLISAVGTASVLLQLGNTSDKWTDPLDALLQAYKVHSDAPVSLLAKLPGNDVKASIESDHGLISVYGKSEGTPHRFWVRLSDRTVVTAPENPPPDIVFAGTVSSPLGCQEEFCFYSLSKKVVTLATSAAGNNGKTKAINIPDKFGELANLIHANGELFVVTNAGYVLRLAQHGTLFLEAVSEQWFEQFEKNAANAKAKWWSVLKEFADGVGVTTVTILGLRDAQQPNNPVVPAWLCAGKVVLGSKSLYGKQVGIAGIANTGQEAWLYQWTAKGQGQLYLQPLLPADQLAQTFKDGGNRVSIVVPEAEQVLESQPFRSVAMVDNNLRYISTDGVILVLASKTDMILYGVDETWAKRRLQSLKADLGEVAKQWGHGEVVALTGANPAWYLTSTGKLLFANRGFTSDDNPRWLGADVRRDRSVFYIYLAAHGTIVPLTAIGEQQPESPGSATTAVRFGDLLVFVPAAETSIFTIPPVENVRFAMMSQPWASEIDSKRHEFACIIPEACWTSYTETVVQWRGSATVSLEAGERELGDLSSLMAKKVAEDLSIVDIPKGRTLTLRKVFSADPEYAKLTVVLGGLNLKFGIADVQHALRDRLEVALQAITSQVEEQSADDSRFRQKGT